MDHRLPLGWPSVEKIQTSVIVVMTDGIELMMMTRAQELLVRGKFW